MIFGVVPVSGVLDFDFETLDVEVEVDFLDFPTPLVARTRICAESAPRDDGSEGRGFWVR